MITTDIIQITEKPSWVTWDDIHNVLWKAHAKNRELGINMKYPSLPGNIIKEKVEGRGKMFVAIDNNKVVGTAAVIAKNSSIWCCHGKVAYCCFSAVLPEYAGKGIYKALVRLQENEAIAMGLNRIMFDSHEKNTRVLDVNKRNGYKAVDYSAWTDHYNIVMMKWFDECPYSDIKCQMVFKLRRFLVRLKHPIKQKNGN